MVNLRAVDLNLFPVFEAVYEERNMTRAADRLAMSQPAVSNAVSRLRTMLRDELFVPGRRGAAVTPLAEQVYPRIKTAMDAAREGLGERRNFVPKTSARRFTVGMLYAPGMAFGKDMADWLRRDAPGLSWRFVQSGDREEAITGGMSVLAFKLGGERYAVEVGAVFQVVDATGLNPLPAAPTWVLGAILARTRVVPVLDLRALLGLENGGMSDLAKIVVLDDGTDLFGIAVEDLEGRLDLEREKLASSADGPFAWIAPDRLAVLDLSRIGAPTTSRGN